MSQHPNITLIGGGSGSFTLLSELKHLTPNLSAIVNMADDGGSTGVLRDELGVLPPGDVRQCLVALSDRPEVRDLFSFRFNEGRFEGQSLGNIILSGLELQYGSFADAIKVASNVLHVTGRVIPATLDKHTLILEDGDETIVSEHVIDHHVIKNTDARVRLEPSVTINPEARSAILGADLVVIAPGNIYDSLLPIFAIDDMAKTLQETKAKLVAITNLATKPGQTDSWHVVDYVQQFERYIGKDEIDVVLYNNEPPSKELLKRYAAEGEYPVGTEQARFKEIKAEAIGAPLVAQRIHQQDPHDKVIKRTLIRHDAEQVCQLLMRLLP